jgi:hypothetical protein
MSWYMAHRAYNFPRASLSLSRGSTPLPHVLALVGVVGVSGATVFASSIFRNSDIPRSRAIRSTGHFSLFFHLRLLARPIC